MSILISSNGCLSYDGEFLTCRATLCASAVDPDFSPSSEIPQMTDPASETPAGFSSAETCHVIPVGDRYRTRYG